MRLNSVVFSFEDRVDGHKRIIEPEGQFLETAQRDLRAFGRDDVSFIRIGDTCVFMWSPKYDRPAGRKIREIAARTRLIDNKEALVEYEDAHPNHFDKQFLIDTESVQPLIVECDGDDELGALFDYYLTTQSIASVVKRGRFGRFLVYDEGAAGRPIMAIIGLSSPSYFNGARDSLLGWSPVGSHVEGEWILDHEAKEKRDEGLLCLSHITAAAAVPPYDRLPIAKLVSALCFSPTVIGHMEETFGRPIAGLTTTGGWGINAAPYQRIHLGLKADHRRRELFQAVRPKFPSLNCTFQYFSDELFEHAFELHRVRSEEPSKALRSFVDCVETRHYLMQWALRYLRIPKKAFYVNRIGHYVGTRNDAAISFLKDVRNNEAPAERMIPVGDSLEWWRSRIERQVATVRAERLSAGAQ